MPLEIIKSDDFIEYFLFPTISFESEEQENEELCKVLHKIEDIAKSYISDYVWHKDSFALKIRNRRSHLLKIESDETLPSHLHGISHFGDNIQDEWFIVSLLFHISREIPSVIIRAFDSDGEFLLIEAAECLPEQWANPETTEQRVFIHNGYLHIVHEETDKADDILSISDGIARIRENPTKFIASREIENCLMERIKNFPASINDNLHRQTVYVPLGVAGLLRHNPQLIAPAVQAFCNRDPIDMKACRAMRYFPPENRTYISAVFTKCLYAMIMHNNYLPDRRTGWNLPSSTSPHFKAHLLGVKIACGFEILASQAKSSTKNFELDKEWQKYVVSLTEKNFFDGELEGSKKYQELMEQAKEYYKENRDTMKIANKIGDDILRDLKQLDINQDEFKLMEESLPASDSDDWLNIAPEELDEMLLKRYGVKNLFEKDPKANAGQLTSMISNFLEEESEFDGVDLNENISPCDVKPKARELSEHLAGGSIKSTKIDFDADAFGATVKNLLDLVIPEDKWDSQSDMSDYENEDDLLAKNIDEIFKNRHLKGRKKKGDKKSEIDKYMEQMDRELASTTIGKSFEKKAAEKQSDNDGFDDIEDFTPVDVDMNTVKSMMESYKLEGGTSGPTSILLSSILKEGGKKQTDV